YEGLTSIGMPEGYGQGGAGAENSNVMEDHSWREAHMPGRAELNWHDGGLPNDDVRNHHDRRRNRRVPGRGAPDFLSRSSRSKDSSGSKDIAGAKDGVVRAGHWGARGGPVGPGIPECHPAGTQSGPADRTMFGEPPAVCGNA